MPSSLTPSASERQGRLFQAVPYLLLGLGFLVRFVRAGSWFLNADEALHYLLSSQPTLALAYRASLTTAHPPLLILFILLILPKNRPPCVS